MRKAFFWFLVTVQYCCIAITAFVSPRSSVVSRSALLPRRSSAVVVDELLHRIRESKNDKAAITSIIQKLEENGLAQRYLDDEKYIGNESKDEGTNSRDASSSTRRLWDSYELAYFDRSIDGGRSDKRRKNKKNGIFSKTFKRMLCLIFGLRYSFQHAVFPDRFVNDVGVMLFGLPLAIVAEGKFTKISPEDVKAIHEETGTELRSDTAVRIDFGPSVLWFGNKRFPLIFPLGSKAQSPPVTLCTTYMDDKVRLALAAKGGRLVFTRGGKALDPFAKDYISILEKEPISGSMVGLTALSVLGTSVCFFPWTRIPVGIAFSMVTAILVKRAFSPIKNVKSSTVTA